MSKKVHKSSNTLSFVVMVQHSVVHVVLSLNITFIVKVIVPLVNKKIHNI